MYLMMLAGEPQERIAALNCVSLETARESNPIATCFAALFKAYRSRARSGPGEYVPHWTLPRPPRRPPLLERYQIDFRNERTIEDALARDLFVAVKRLSKDFGLSFAMNSVQQYAQ